MRTTVTIEATGGSTTGIRLPDVAVELGAGRRPRVRATFPNGHVLRVRVGSHDGDPFLPVSAATRDAAQVAAGDTVELDLAVDDEPVQVEVPEELRAALDAAPDARTFFDGLTSSQRKGFATSVSSAKKPETRRARIEKAIAALEAGRKRP